MKTRHLLAASSERPGLSRRAVLQGSLGLASLALVPPANAESAADPHVWGGMTQEELDRAYSQGPWAPNWSEIWERYSENSERARKRLGEPRQLRFGETPDETLDLYPADGSNLPVHIFVHGGAWFTGDSRRHGFLAETFVNAGAHFIAVNYSSVDDTGGSLLPLADQVRRAVRWVFMNADSFGADKQRIHISDHSSGAHLAAVAMTTDWQGQFNLPQDIIKGGLLCSGMYDLEPVSLLDRREYVRFDRETVEDLSPQRHLDYLAAPIIVTYGTLESPEFQRQSRDFSTAVNKQGKDVNLIAAENYNHFEIIETLANPYGLLGFPALQQMGLA
ncbi:alpha/beta hydrolase [Lentisalinibacter salinarum]|uniref:alpha/beta hydrolase n=1 Tax=Lentisalinibacter salinarum TaxID=2992239 RepID=UPI0038686426